MAKPNERKGGSNKELPPSNWQRQIIDAINAVATELEATKVIVGVLGQQLKEATERESAALAAIDELRMELDKYVTIDKLESTRVKVEQVLEERGIVPATRVTLREIPPEVPEE